MKETFPDEPISRAPYSLWNFKGAAGGNRECQVKSEAGGLKKLKSFIKG